MSPSEQSEHPAGEVLSGLPRTRPGRRSARRAAPADDGFVEVVELDVPARAAAPSQRKAAAPKRKPAARRPAAPEAAAPAGKPPPAPERTREPDAADLVAGVVEAAGELTRAGMAFGVAALRQAVARLPRR